MMTSSEFRPFEGGKWAEAPSVISDVFIPGIGGYS